MKKNIVAVVVMFLCLLFVMPVYAANVTNVSISPSERSGEGRSNYMFLIIFDGSFTVTEPTDIVVRTELLNLDRRGYLDTSHGGHIDDISMPGSDFFTSPFIHSLHVEPGKHNFDFTLLPKNTSHEADFSIYANNELIYHWRGRVTHLMTAPYWETYEEWSLPNTAVSVAPAATTNAVLPTYDLKADGGAWSLASGIWYYTKADGAKLSSAWAWIDGNKDGIAECYCFDGNGKMYSGVTTPDGHTVNTDGAWTVGGTVQKK